MFDVGENVTRAIVVGGVASVYVCDNGPYYKNNPAKIQDTVPLEKQLTDCENGGAA